MALDHASKTPFAAAAPTSTATLLLAANPGRVRALLRNNGATVVFLGNTAAVTAATGFPLQAGETLEDAQGSDAWYGVTAGATGDVRVLETF